MEATCDRVLRDIGNPAPLGVTALLYNQGLRHQVGGPGFPRNIRGLLKYCCQGCGKDPGC